MPHTMINVPFDAEAIEALRSILKPKRKRYDLAFTMNRWAEIVRDDADTPDNAPIEEEQELVGSIVGVPTETRYVEEDGTPARRRRERVDPERWAALLLAVIFSEFTKTKPTRITKDPDLVKDTLARDKTSPFYRFATTAFEAVGRKPSESAFREATERWAR